MHVQGVGGSRWLGLVFIYSKFCFHFFFLIVGYLIWFFFIFFVLITDYFWYYRICNTIDGIKRETKRREREERKRRSHIQL